MSELTLSDWIELQFKNREKLFKNEKDNKKREKILYSLAKLLRQYVNSNKTKTGLSSEQKQKAYRMTAFLEAELLERDWSPDSSYAFDTLLYARKYAGGGAAEGAALRSNLTAGERAQLDALTRKAKERANRGLGELDSENLDRSDVLRDLALLSDPPEVDTPGDPGRLSDDSDSDTEMGL